MRRVISIAIVLTFLMIINTMKIHVVPHTHDDAGWIWTFDNYYYRTGGSWASVQKILENMVLSLYDNTDRTFIYVEMAFFTKWYNDQTDETKEKVKELLKQERFEFINGGYVMHDEATTYYQHFIDQMRLGLLFLKREFDYSPKVAWFIDPFGHSAANAYILSKMGFEKMVIVRIDYKEKDIRRANQTLEFYYKPFSEIDKNARIFTHVTYNHYCNPDGMDSFLTDIELTMSDDELKNRGERTYNDLKKISGGYKTDNVLMMYGCDFSHNARDNNFLNLEKLMKYVNTNFNDIQMAYSTPSKYFDLIFETAHDWPEYSNVDFFPYAEYPYSYWTGYYSSRPFLKGLVRETADYLTMSSIFVLEMMLNDLTGNSLNKSSINTYDQFFKSQFYMREKLAICQHHDAVAGTAREKTSEDYIDMMNSSIDKVKKSVGDLVGLGTNVHICVTNPTVHSECQNLILNDSNIQNVYINNPGLNGIFPVSFDYFDSKLKIFDVKGDEIKSSIVCLEGIINLITGLKCKINFVINFEKSNLFYQIIIKKTTNNNELNKTLLDNITDFSIGQLKLNFDISSLNLKIENKSDSKIYILSAKHGYFTSYDGSNSNIRPYGSNPAGAYILSTVEETPNIYKLDTANSYIHKSENFIQISLKFENSYLTLKYIDEYTFELETIWDKITTEERKVGKEYLLILSSDIKNEVNIDNGQSIRPEIWTDSNGLKLMRRIKDFRAGYNYEVTEKIASNFYPVNYIASMRDRVDYKYTNSDYTGMNENDRIISLINDRAQSVGSLKQGEMIVILNRHSTRDDWKGLEEPLFENASADGLRIRHIIVLSNKFDQKFIRNYITNKPFFFFQSNKTKHAHSLKEKTKKLFTNGLDRSNLYKIIEKSSNIDLNFHLLKPGVVLVQVTSLVDPYFNNTEEYVTFKETENIHYSIVEHNLAGTSMNSLNKTRLLQGVMNNRTYKLKPQELKLFLMTFKN